MYMHTYMLNYYKYMFKLGEEDESSNNRKVWMAISNDDIK